MAKNKRPGSRDDNREPSRELPTGDSQSTSRIMSNRQLEQLRETLDSIVEDLCNREQAVDKEQAHLLERLNELDERQSHLKSLEDIVAQHQANEQQLAEQLQSLISGLDQRATAQPQWMSTALDALEQRLLDKLQAQQGQQPNLADMVSEMERVQSRSVQSLVEQLTISLQTAIAVQLAPLTDQLPEQLTSALANLSPSSPLSTPELARELEKFESRSMASLAARMTAGLQTALAAQWDSLTASLPEKLATILAKSQPSLGVHPVPIEHHSDQLASQLQSRIERLTQAAGAASKPTFSLDTCQLAACSSPEQKTLLLIDTLAAELEKAKHSLAESEALLSEALEHSHELEISEASSKESHDSEAALVETLRAEIADLRKLLAAKEHDSRLLEELRQEIDQLRGEKTSDGQAPKLDAELRERLEMATCEIIDLRSQNEELNERVTRLQISTAAHGHAPHLGQEGLSWEERKKLLLAQLDAEQDGVEPDVAAAKRLEVEDVLKTTDAELARRDREIAELRSLLQQQADAREGMAVGAAAVAQLVESDELVQEEREKLRTLQKSWEEKLRQSEIEISMERAKLARERLQLEEQKQELEAALHAAAQNQSDDPKDKIDPKGRKWLSRLGLKDEK